MRYLLHESQHDELLARQKYLYDVFHLYFIPDISDNGFITLKSVGCCFNEILFSDQKFGVGDIVLSSTSAVTTNGAVMPGITIASISEYNKVYDLVKKIQTDIYSDTMYPNDMRPKENHGYNTEYKGM